MQKYYVMNRKKENQGLYTNRSFVNFKKVKHLKEWKFAVTPCVITVYLGNWLYTHMGDNFQVDTVQSLTFGATLGCWLCKFAVTNRNHNNWRKWKPLLVYHHHHLWAALPVPFLAYPYDREAESQCALGPVCSQLQGFLPKHVKPLRRDVHMIQLAPL